MRRIPQHLIAAAPRHANIYNTFVSRCCAVATTAQSRNNAPPGVFSCSGDHDGSAHQTPLLYKPVTTPRFSRGYSLDRGAVTSPVSISLRCFPPALVVGAWRRLQQCVFPVSFRPPCRSPRGSSRHDSARRPRRPFAAVTAVVIIQSPDAVPLWPFFFVIEDGLATLIRRKGDGSLRELPRVSKRNRS